MTSIAVDQTQIDIALAAHYSGLEVLAGNPEVSTSVRVFIETPDPEMVPERVFPSISIMMSAINPAYELYDSTDFEEEEISVDSVLIPPEREMRESPLPYSLIYMIHTWYKARSKGDRDLVKDAVFRKTKPRGYFTAETIDGNAVNLDLYWEGGLVNRDESDVDELIFHKVVPVSVIAHMAAVEEDETRSEKTVLEVHHTFRNYKLLESGEVVRSKIDLSLKIDENGVERL